MNVTFFLSRPESETERFCAAWNLQVIQRRFPRAQVVCFGIEEVPHERVNFLFGIEGVREAVKEADLLFWGDLREMLLSEILIDKALCLWDGGADLMVFARSPIGAKPSVAVGEPLALASRFGAMNVFGFRAVGVVSGELARRSAVLEAAERGWFSFLGHRIYRFSGLQVAFVSGVANRLAPREEEYSVEEIESYFRFIKGMSREGFLPPKLCQNFFLVGEERAWLRVIRSLADAPPPVRVRRIDLLNLLADLLEDEEAAHLIRVGITMGDLVRMGNSEKRYYGRIACWVRWRGFGRAQELFSNKAWLR